MKMLLLILLLPQWVINQIQKKIDKLQPKYFKINIKLKTIFIYFYNIKESKDYAEKHGLLHFEVSAKKNINIQEVFLEIAKKLPI